jgi:hypothetical protein
MRFGGGRSLLDVRAALAGEHLVIMRAITSRRRWRR